LLRRANVLLIHASPTNAERVAANQRA
jgi:hypothetical protein